MIALDSSTSRHDPPTRREHSLPDATLKHDVDKLTLTPIGVIHSEHREPARTPIQPVCAQGVPGRVEVFPEYADGLDDVEGFSHLYLIYWFHRLEDLGEPAAERPRLKVVPYLDDVARGVFATRSPLRPSPIGLSIVRLVERRGTELLVEDLDALDGTPLLDIKPYVERFDLRLDTRGGWTDEVSPETFRCRGERRSERQ